MNSHICDCNFVFICSSFRSSIFVYRYGAVFSGEELMLIMDLEEGNLTLMLKELRDKIYAGIGDDDEDGANE